MQEVFQRMKPLKINFFLRFNFMGAQFLLHVGQLCCNNCTKKYLFYGNVILVMIHLQGYCDNGNLS